MNEFVTWTSLGTYAGAVMMVTIITQFLKQTPLKNINTQLLAYIISVTILIGAEAFNGSALTVQGVVLCLLNAVIVALAANGTYDAATTGMVKKVKEEEFPLEEVEKDASSVSFPRTQTGSPCSVLRLPRRVRA